ncbi:MAG: MerR family transcriptional regulator [Gammaproteobacteria bacterium]|nr:MerR family transcriptional regulator [Gammaproteobacteria bacterium]MCW5582684.1 MerR family transcriptional regulator [Gammaproteobacteria bacterium]
MTKHELMIITNYSQENLSFDELCEICRISPDVIYELISYDIIHPKQPLKQEQWKFNVDELRRIKTALRLQHDLEVNLAGVALVLDLLDEINELRHRAEFLEKQFLQR